MRPILALALLAILGLAATGCGATKKIVVNVETRGATNPQLRGGAGARHIYIVKPSVNGVPIRAYVTIVSPVAFPHSVLDREEKGAIFVHPWSARRSAPFRRKWQGRGARTPS